MPAILGYDSPNRGATLTKDIVEKFKTAIFASAVSASLIELILFLARDITVSSLSRAFETAFYAFTLGAIGANAYIWLADKFSILGRVVRTNLIATLKALVILIPLATVLSLVAVVLRAPHEAFIWIYVAILFSCAISDAAYAYRSRVYEL